jgi:ApeA N-terminal domain 1
VDQLRGNPLQGEWWEPELPSDKFKGTLQIEENDHGTLTIRGSEKRLLKFVRPGTRTIFGRLTNHSRCDVTLFTVGMITSLTGFTDYGERETDIEFFTNIILVGFHAASQDDPIVSRVLLRVTGLEEWCDTTGFSGQLDLSNAMQGAKRVDVSYAGSSSIPYSIGSGKSLRLLSHYKGPMSFHRPKRISMSEENIIELCFENRLSLNDVLHETSIWQNFLTFALRDASYLSDLRLSVGSTTVQQINCTLLVPGRRVETSGQRRRVTEVLFTRSKIEDRLEEYFRNWRRHYETIEMPVLLFTGTAYDRSDFIHSRLLSYLQALEVLHRELFGGNRFPDKETRRETIKVLKDAIPAGLDPTLRTSIEQQLAFVGELTLLDRLKDLFGRYRKSLDPLFPDPDADMELLRDARNFLTHFGTRRQFSKDILWSRELMALSDRAKLFMEICLLGVLSMSDEQIQELIRTFEPYVQASYERRNYPPRPIDR